MYKKIHVIINPASGKDQPILNIINRVFQEANIQWDVSVTKEAGDAYSFTKEAVDTDVDVVAVYGGDGTVSEVASGLLESDVLLAILPGGTGNAMSAELDIPSELESACKLAYGDNSTTQKVDIGQINERYFILRVGIGYDAEGTKNADRDKKDDFGVLAYIFAALSELSDSPVIRYTLTLDGKEVEVEGLTCIIANSSGMGWSRLKLAKNISPFDGKLDVIIIEDANIGSLLSLSASIIGSDNIESVSKESELSNNSSLHHWQVKEVDVVTDSPQAVHYDGDFIGHNTHNTARILPASVNIIVPEDSDIV